MAKDENKESEIRGDEQEIVDQRLPVWRPQDADREYYRYETKKRIQHYTVPPQTIILRILLMMNWGILPLHFIVMERNPAVFPCRFPENTMSAMQ